MTAARSWIRVTCSAEDLLAIAQTAWNNLLISDLVCRAMKEAGPDGIIVVENGAGRECELSVQEGLRFDRGYLSPKFVTNVGPERCELAECRILVHELKISNMKDLLPLLEQIARSSFPVLVSLLRLSSGNLSRLSGRSVSTLATSWPIAVMRCPA